MLACKYLVLIAAILCCLSGALAVTCADDPSDANCIDCNTDTTNDECTTTTTTTTVAPTSTSTSTAASVAATTKKPGNVKKVTIKNMKFKVKRKIKVVKKSG
ncbi:uncharacterized protein LOC108139104 [Drosophila elegans]|uniref:uncharacterized protein LOC108139104 n=1 Tax=Drosophila elegans TaxID=30023 RepID=UPI0007E635BD|nr:uncharacterized protein LOC108139104 [Drosophila elegans]